MFDRLRSLFRPKPVIADPYEQFVVAFIEECGRQGRKPASYDHQTRSFVFGDPKGSSHTVFLENNFRAWCQGDAKARAEQLSRFVRSLGEAEAAIDSANLLAELMPGIRSRVLLSHALIQNWIQGAPEDNDNETAWTPFCGELVACVVRDRQDSMALVTRSNLDSAKLSFDQALAQAMVQFRAKAPAPDFVPDPRAAGLYYCGNLEDYQSSLLLMTPGKDFQLPALDGDAVALVPSRNQFFVTGSRNGPALKALLDLAETAGQQSHFCSSAPLVWCDGHWVEYVFEAGTNEAVKQRQIAIAQLASDYDRQKELLDHLHRVQNKDIHVASFMVFQKKNQAGSEFSMTTLASGTHGTLLPVADRLTFVDQIIDPQTGLAAKEPRDIISVAWSDAMADAGHLFQRVPNLFPPRYRSLGFPDGDVWAKLRTRPFD
jgi:hypothetical protein